MFSSSNISRTRPAPKNKNQTTSEAETLKNQKLQFLQQPLERRSNTESVCVRLYSLSVLNITKKKKRIVRLMNLSENHERSFFFSGLNQVIVLLTGAGGVFTHALQR